MKLLRANETLRRYDPARASLLFAVLQIFQLLKFFPVPVADFSFLQVRMIKILDEVGLVSQDHCAALFLHQTEGLRRIKVGLNDYGRAANHWCQHNLDGAARVEEGLCAEETVLLGKL